MKYDVFADWEINLFCNLNCSYCFFYSNKKRKDPRYRGYYPEDIVDFFDNTYKTWLIHMTGGEPFFVFNFVDLCKRLTAKHYISVNSNLSTPNVYTFADMIDSKRVVRINASLHMTYRKDLEEFINKVEYLKKHDFCTHVSQVMYPPILKNFEETYRIFQERDIPIRPKIFRGYYQMRRYPQSYTDKEKRLFMKYYLESEKTLDMKSDSNLDWIFFFEKYLLDSELSFKGVKCSSGKKYVYIKNSGDVIRCVSEPCKLGNIVNGRIDLHKEPQICKKSICSCPHYGLKYAEEKPSRKIFPVQGLSLMLIKKAMDLKENIQYFLS